MCAGHGLEGKKPSDDRQVYIYLGYILRGMSPRPTILNREAWLDALTVLADAPVSVLRVNVDAFGSLQEGRGQAEAEALLRGLERLLTERLPGDTKLGRLSTDEYAVLLSETTPETALRLADELTRTFARHRDPLWPRSVGLSIGVAARPAHARTAHDLLRAADEALLRAKREGRGRAALYTPAKMVLKSNYYPRSQLERLKKRAAVDGVSEAEILRAALEQYLAEHPLK